VDLGSASKIFQFINENILSVICSSKVACITALKRRPTSKTKLTILGQRSHGHAASSAVRKTKRPSLILVSSFGVGVAHRKTFEVAASTLCRSKGCEFVARATVTAVMEISHENTSGVVTEQLGPTP